MRMTRSPSESVKNLASIKSAVEDPSGPRFGRPSDRFGPPTVLFSRELALLKHDLDHLGAFMPDYICVGHAHSLIENATNFFNNEGERETVLLPILRRLLVGNSDWRVRILDGSDGGWLEEFFAYPIIDMKDEQGLGGDPFLRGLVVYGKALAHEKVRYFSYLLHSTTTPRTVSPIPWSIEPTGPPARHRGQPSYPVDRNFHRLRLLR